MLFVASVAKSSTAAREECMIHVKMAATSMAISGSLCSGCMIRGSVSEFASGDEASFINARDRSIRPRPIMILNKWRLRPPCSYFKCPIMPIIKRAGDIHDRFRVRT